MSYRRMDVLVTDETLSAIKKRAFSEGKSTSAITRKLLEDALDNPFVAGGGTSVGGEPETIRKMLEEALKPLAEKMNILVPDWKITMADLEIEEEDPEQLRKEVDSAIAPVLNAIGVLRGEVAGLGSRPASRENSRLIEILETVQEIARNIKAPASSPEIGKKLDEILGLLNRTVSPEIPNWVRSAPEKVGIFRKVVEGFGNWWNGAYWPERIGWISGVLAIVVLIVVVVGLASTPSPVPGPQN